MAAFSTVRTARNLPVLPATAFGSLDSEPLLITALTEPNIQELATTRRVSADLVERAVAAGDAWPKVARDLAHGKPEILEQLTRLYASTYRVGDNPFHIVDVVPDGPVLSGRPFQLRVEYANAAEAPAVLARVRVGWAGETFTVEQVLDERGGEGRVGIDFDDERTLPVGQAQFDVRLYRADGSSSAFTRSVFVLPSNPLALSLSPAGARVTGTWSARGDYLPGTDAFLTEVELTISNGDALGVGMRRRVEWEFWDGGVGGTLVESGAFDWPSVITVGANGVWRGFLSFTSPRGSGVFNNYERKEDLLLVLRLVASDGRVISGQITSRVMLALGINIIKVGNFGTQEHVDLYAAVDALRQILERRDITLRGVNRHILSDTLAGGYTILDSEDEFRDMLEDWSVPNDFVDIYVVRQVNWGGFNGYAGDEPGPNTKGGRTDGVAADRTGFTDASGTPRLNVGILSQLIGHEIGHYLGLPHQETTDNLMRSNTGDRGPVLDYDQYRKAFPHGYLVFT
ncbi:hypothetical protein [Pseudarthrobacter sp. PvP090]|uniref:hypothetical protein n=1 Tax=Pseudarthrobacter sp. PvP090 TaxID=3156393 RepID=UPI00339413E8